MHKVRLIALAIVTSIAALILPATSANAHAGAYSHWCGSFYLTWEDSYSSLGAHMVHLWKVTNYGQSYGNFRETTPVDVHTGTINAGQTRTSGFHTSRSDWQKFEAWGPGLGNCNITRS